MIARSSAVRRTKSESWVVLFPKISPMPRTRGPGELKITEVRRVFCPEPFTSVLPAESATLPVASSFTVLSSVVCIDSIRYTSRHNTLVTRIRHIGIVRRIAHKAHFDYGNGHGAPVDSRHGIVALN